MPATSSIVKTSLFGLALAAAINSSLILWCQESTLQLSPRELYYREPAAEPDQRPSTTASKKRVVEKETAAGSASLIGSSEEGKDKGSIAGSAEKISTMTAKPGVAHLGLRYSLLLVDKRTGDAKSVSPNQTFDQGECLSVEFQSNRSGYLYVFNLGSSGAWKPLLPTQEMPDEGNFIPANTTVQVPAAHCFRISGPPGSERLFVALSRNPQEVNELDRTIRNGSAGEPEHPPQQRDAGGAVLAMANNLNQEVEKIASLKGRDLEIEAVGGTENSSATEHAVYVVHTSATPSDKIVTEIHITHR